MGAAGAASQAPFPCRPLSFRLDWASALASFGGVLGWALLLASAMVTATATTTTTACWGHLAWSTGREIRAMFGTD